MNSNELYSLDEALDYLNGKEIIPINNLLMETYNEAVLFNELITESNIKESVKSLWERFKAWLEKFKLHFQAAFNRLSTFINSKLGSVFIAGANANIAIIKKINSNPKNIGKFNQEKAMTVKDRLDFNKTLDNISVVEDYLNGYKNIIEGILKDNSIDNIKNWDFSDIKSLTTNEDKARNELNELYKKTCNSLGIKGKGYGDDLIFKSKDIEVHSKITQVTLNNLMEDLNDSINFAKIFKNKMKLYNKLSKEVTLLVNKTEFYVSAMISAMVSEANENNDGDPKISFAELNGIISNQIRYINELYMNFNKISMELVNSCVNVIIDICAQISVTKGYLREYVNED